KYIREIEASPYEGMETEIKAFSDILTEESEKSKLTKANVFLKVDKHIRDLKKSNLDDKDSNIQILTDLVKENNGVNELLEQVTSLKRNLKSPAVHSKALKELSELSKLVESRIIDSTLEVGK